MVRAHEWDGSRRLGRVPASRRPWWAAHPAPVAALRLEWVAGGAWSVLAVAGDLDARTAAQLDAFVSGSLPAGCAVLELELGGVRSLGSAGLSGLLSLHRWCGQRGVELRVRGALPSVERVFEVGGLDATFTAIGGATRSDDPALF
jgi:anti-sigma B factor antagonist